MGQNRLHDSRRLADLEVRRHTVIRRDRRPGISRRKPFEPYCVNTGSGDQLAVYFGGINASSIGLGNLVPTYNGTPMNPPGPITGPLPASPGTFWVTACLDVTMSGGNSPGSLSFCDCIQSVDASVIIQAATATGAPNPSPDATLQCGFTDDPDTQANEGQSAQSGKIYFDLWQFNYAISSTGSCVITHGIRDESNYYLCCIGDRLFLRAGPEWS